MQGQVKEETGADWPQFIKLPAAIAVLLMLVTPYLQGVDFVAHKCVRWVESRLL